MSDPFADLIAANPLPPAPGAGAGSGPATSPVAARTDPFEALLAANPKPAEPSRVDRAASVAGDIVQSAGAGLIKGAAGLLDAPQAVYGFADHWIGEGVKGAGRAIGLTPNSDRGIDTRSQSVIPSPADLPKPGETAVHALEAATGKLYEPQTTAGKFARTAAEFIPGAGKRLGEVAAYGVIPGLASEGAGQVTEGSALETPARIVAGVAAGLGGAAFRAPGNADKLVADRMKGVSPQQVDQAEALFQEAAARGLPLTRANAVDAVTNGVTSLSDLQRVLEGNGRLKQFYAPTAGAVEREGRGTLDAVAAPGATPTALGGEIQDAARAGVAQTPQGMALAEAQAAAGPRVTPEQAGQVIQPELRRVYDRREGMRAALGEQDYAAARAAPETVGIERTVQVERPGEPVTTYPKLSRPEFTEAAPRPLESAPAAAPAAAEAGRPAQGMLDYLARNGGIPLEAETRAGDLNRAYRPGAGTLARNGAPTWDQIRVRLAEEGFLPPGMDGTARAGDVRDFVLDVLHQERIGRGRTVRMGEDAALPQRRGADADELANARSLAESRLDEGLRGAGVDPASVHPDIRSRVLGAMERDAHADPLDAYERTVGAMKGPLEPYTRSTRVTEEIPDVRFGQANPQSVVDHIDEALASAKGPVAKALAAARDTLFTNASGGRPRELDLSIAGLHGAREAINDLIAKAEPTAQRALMGVRERLDGALSTVPEYERARSGFEAASRNLDPFAPSAAPGRIVDREQATGRHTMPPENVPAAIDAGPSQGRAFNEVAPPEARQAYEGHMRTALLDAATDARTGEISSAKIREMLRSNEDGLRQFPAVRRHLEEVAFAREGREAVDRSPLGRIASDPKVEKAIDALFPTNPLPGSSVEVGDAVRRMAAAHPRAASELVRMHIEQVFNEATQRLQSGANQAGGAKFSAVLVGNREQAASLEAAVKALPGGEQTWTGIRRLLDVFDAQGTRQAVGSGTSFNNTIQADLKAGKPIGEAGAAIATGGVKLPTRIMQKIEGWRMGEGLDEMARLFTDPKMAGAFRRLATQPPGSAAGITHLAGMIVGRAVRGYNSGQRPDPAAGAVREPLKLTVTPRP